MSQYQPKNSLVSPRFEGIKTFMRLPHLETTDDVDFLIIGVPFDTSCSFRVGSRFAPASLREASVFFKSYNEDLEVNIFDNISGVDYGDIDIVPGFIMESYEKIEAALTPIFQKRIIPICMGGDHSITLPELRALAKTQGPVALVHFDSHSDVFDSYIGQKYNHGSPFRRAVEEGLLLPENSIQVGLRAPQYSREERFESSELGFDYITGSQLHRMGIEQAIARIRQRVGNAPVFVTFDIDFFDPAYAPGTGTPELAGFTTWEGLELVRGMRGFDFRGFDLVEVLPPYDHAMITAFAGAGVMWQFLSLVALNVANNK